MKCILFIFAVLAGIEASPLLKRQGVTSAISPSAAPPSGCNVAYSGTFGIAAMNITASSKAKRQISTISDGQPRVPPTQSVSVVPITTISDGQPQASKTQIRSTVAPVTQLSDGQPNVGPHKTMVPVTQIGDGQIQAPTITLAPVGQISDGQIQNPKKTGTPITQISDGQPQAPKGTPITQISDGQPQAPKGTPVSQISDGQPQAPKGTPVTQITDGQPQAPPKTATGISSISDGQPQKPTGTGSSSPSSTVMVACKTNSTLELSINNGVLKDNKGRTGYIASNYQFQFDAPPQAGAIYTSGFSVCGNGSLALGGSTTFYQCRSGDFYNLYDRHWASQCNPVTIEILQLQTCNA